MKAVTYEQVLAMSPCWCSTGKGRRRLKRYADKLGGKATALDILRLSRVPAADRLWLVLREDFVDAPMLHEIACRCAERALTQSGVTDKRCWDAIEAKRGWLRGEVSGEQLAAARAAARAAAWDAALAAARDVARAAARDAARSAASDAARDAARSAASDAARSAASAAARGAEQKWQIDELSRMLIEVEEEEAPHD